MRFLASQAFVFCLVYPASSQVEHGTVGVVHFTKEHISVAADSRGIFKGSGLPPDDTICKIAALGGNVVFVSAGVLRYPGYSALVPSWDNVAEARSAYNRIRSTYSTVRGHVGEMAQEWTRVISADFDAMALWQPNVFREAINDVGGLTDAMIAGQDATGNLVLYGMRIIAGTTTDRGVQGTSVQAYCPHHDFCAIGQPEIVIEFADLTSKRATDEATSWSPRDDLSPGDAEYDMLWTMRMAELTIMYHQGNDVGGKIDGVQLNRDGTVHWQERKDICPDN